MLRSVIATVLAVGVSAAIGCSKKNVPAPEGQAATGTVQKTVTVPTDESGKNVDVTVPLPQPFYESGEVGASLKPDGSVDLKKDDFYPTDHMYVSIKAREVPSGLAANITIRDPEKKTVFDTRSEFSPATKRAVFTVGDLAKWKPALYDLEVVMEGDVVYKHGVRILDKGGSSKKK